MNFKNISLFSLLLVAGFVGTVTQAQDEFNRDEFAANVGSYLREKLVYKKDELKGLLNLDRVYGGIFSMAEPHCFGPEESRESRELCWYSAQIGDKRNALAADIDKLQDEIKEIKSILNRFFESPEEDLENIDID